MVDLAPYETCCHNRKKAGLFRTLSETQALPRGHIRCNEKEYVNFSSNNYLGLSRHPALIEKACVYAQTYGAGSTASRLISGNNRAYEEIESALAKGKGKESALIMASGYQTNVSVLSALADKSVIGREAIILADRLAHHSLLQGAALAKARLMRFRHNDYGHLESILKAQTEKNAFCIIVSESVFGMDGDCADLAALGSLAQKYKALLYIDEAHATGVWGKNGFGFTVDCPFAIDVSMGTFGKALGSFGAYVACASKLRDYLVQKCGGLIYSTALPPAVLGSIAAALDLIPQMEPERLHLRALSARLRAALKNQGWDCGASVTQIVPVIVGEEKSATDISADLRTKGFLVPAIRPPTVPPRGSRVRISVSAAHEDADIDALIAAMAALAPRFARDKA